MCVFESTDGLCFVFAVPDSLLNPSAAPPAPSSEDRKAPCMLQKLSSDPDVHVAPLDGCKHVTNTSVDLEFIHKLLIMNYFFSVGIDESFAVNGDQYCVRAVKQD